MFVLSLRSSKLRLVAAIAAAVICVGTAAVVLSVRAAKEADAAAGKRIKGSSESDRIDFLAGFGWEVETENSESSQVIIPAEFDDVYKEYNELQRSQGFNLEKYCGRRAERWTYRINNYPGYADGSDCIRANILVYGGEIIGGDICSVELGGFMHGFAAPETQTTSA